MASNLPQVAVITDVITNPALLHIGVDLLDSRYRFDHPKSLPNRTGIGLSATEIVHFAGSRAPAELQHQRCNIFRMDIVPDLLAFVAKYLILPAFDVAFNQVTEESV